MWAESLIEAERQKERLGREKAWRKTVFDRPFLTVIHTAKELEKLHNSVTKIRTLRKRYRKGSSSIIEFRIKRLEREWREIRDGNEHPNT